MIHYKFKNIEIGERSKRTYIDFHKKTLIFSYFSVSKSDIRITRFIKDYSGLSLKVTKVQI